MVTVWYEWRSWKQKQNLEVHTFAAGVCVVEFQTCLTLVGDGVAAAVKVAGASDVAYGTSAAASGGAVYRGHCDNLTMFDGGSGSDKAEHGDEESEGVHLRPNERDRLSVILRLMGRVAEKELQWVMNDSR